MVLESRKSPVYWDVGMGVDGCDTSPQTFCTLGSMPSLKIKFQIGRLYYWWHNQIFRRSTAPDLYHYVIKYCY